MIGHQVQTSEKSEEKEVDLRKGLTEDYNINFSRPYMAHNSRHYGAVVRAIASHQYGAGSNRGPGVLSGLSML